MFYSARFIKNLVRSWFTPGKHETTRRKNAGFRPQIDLLEDRVVPASFSAAASNLQIDLATSETFGVTTTRTNFQFALSADIGSSFAQVQKVDSIANLQSVAIDSIGQFRATAALTDGVAGLGFSKEVPVAMKPYVSNLSDESLDPSPQVIMDPDRGHSKGFGFVEMGTSGEAQTAINPLQGKETDGRNLTVNEARPHEERGSGSRGLPGN
jgi:RNA recognition motif-containing protein